MLHELLRHAAEGAPAPADEATWLRSAEQSARPRWPAQPTAVLLVACMAVTWSAGFGWLAVQRHLAGGSNAEDLGFTDQVLGNFLRGQWFRMSIYQGATWNTEIDVSRLARPDSLLAFHFEPMLLLLVPLYALGGGATLLLILQAVALSAGAVPAYRLGRHSTGSTWAGLAVSMAYLLSPPGQWAVLSDFHTSTLAAPLLILAVERLVVGRSARQCLVIAALAATAREDVGPVLVALGLALCSRNEDWRRVGLGLAGIGAMSTVIAWLVVRAYSGGAVAFEVRYTQTLSGGLGGWMSALERPIVLDYARTLLQSGGWLGLLSPMDLVPALPGLALNALSSSPWMAAGKAHYSGLVLPWIVVGAAAALGRLRTQPALCTLAATGLMLTSCVAYVQEGAGPWGGSYAPASITSHASAASAIASSLPLDASVSATSSLVPRLSRRAHLYVFPAVLDAEYVFLDLQASPAPTSAGDVYLRVGSLLAQGDWGVQSASDGLLLLERTPDAARLDPADLGGRLTNNAPVANPLSPEAAYFDNRVSLVSAQLVPSPTGAIDVDGPRWTLRTVWRARQSLPPGTHVAFSLELRDGRRLGVEDVASLWWNPPERWVTDQPVTVDVPDIPMREFASWQAAFSP